ncbi:MAG TPA: efflux RND transporter periplasmic adaptor subunit [Cyclobacteriaceae bacterium]|jgi:cobalt-zinc-cadmium efflux system membrane fusion protein|nr:efflux RND transporter periplasmic adaptor subunit [Cyclobacteriaceae bacterium]
MNTSSKFLFICFSSIILSCSAPSEKKESTSTVKKKTNEVVLSDEQFKSINIQLNSVENRSLSGSIKANGVLDVPPQNLVSISAPLGGFVKSTELLQGMHVKKGQIVAILEHPDYIQLQQDYLDNKNQLEFLEQEYNRQLDLSKENVNALKALQQSKSAYLSTKAKVAGLKAKLKLVNINPADIESGEIKNSVNIISPIAGFVSQVNVNIGMHVNPTDIMFRIVDTEHVHAEAQIFEKDIPKLKVGQLAHILLSNETKERLAKVFLIGKEITAERTVRVHCHLEGEDANLIPGTYFSAVIETGLNSVSALPVDAIVNFEAKHFVFVEKDAATHRYELLEIKTGASDGGYTEIDSQLNDFKNKIVVSGSFELLNTLKNVEE